MSSGQWEVVGKSKKTQNGKVKSTNDEKKPVKNGPKPDDVGKFTQLYFTNPLPADFNMIYSFLALKMNV